jgi:hypothetical protein
MHQNPNNDSKIGKGTKFASKNFQLARNHSGFDITQTDISM